MRVGDNFRYPTLFTARLRLGWSFEKACRHFTNKHKEGKVKVFHVH